MGIINKLAIYIVFSLLALYSSMAANFASPLLPGEEPAASYIGIILGAGQNIQHGIAYVSCDSCFFTGGVNSGYSIGLNFEKQLSGDIDSYWNNFKYGMMFLYSTKNINPTFIENTKNYFSEYEIDILLLQKHTNNISISSLGLTPHLTYEFYKFIFARLGFSVDYLISSNIKHEIELLEKTKILPNGEEVDIYIPIKNSNKKTYKYTAEDNSIKELNKLQFSFLPGAGLNINLSSKMFLSASFNYMVPLNNISNFGENFRESAWRIFLELTYKLTNTNKIYK